MEGFIHYSGRLKVNAKDPDAFRRRFLDVTRSELKKLWPNRLALKGNVIYFHGGMFRLVSRWNLLSSIPDGEIEALSSTNGVEIRYEICFDEPIFAITIQMLILAFFVVAVNGQENVSMAGIAICVGVYFGLLTLGILIAIFRFRRFLKACARKAGA